MLRCVASICMHCTADGLSLLILFSVALMSVKVYDVAFASLLGVMSPLVLLPLCVLLADRLLFFFFLCASAS